jgi:hypothetical protein
MFSFSSPKINYKVSKGAKEGNKKAHNQNQKKKETRQDVS